jgi:hypothetical protein
MRIQVKSSSKLYTVPVSQECLHLDKFTEEMDFGYPEVDGDWVESIHNVPVCNTCGAVYNIFIGMWEAV